MLENGLGGLVHASEPQGLGAFRCPPSLLQTGRVQVGLWKEEGGDGAHVHGFGQREHLVPLLPQPLHVGGLAGRCCSRGGCALRMPVTNLRAMKPPATNPRALEMLATTSRISKVPVGL